MLPVELLKYVIRPVLAEFGRVNPKTNSKTIEALLLGTAMVESRVLRITQMGGGPAQSYFQIEPFTARDIINRTPTAYQDVFDLFAMDYATQLDQITANQHLACCVARMKYWLDKKPVPTGATGLAEYHKRVYNTPLGKANVEDNIDDFMLAMSMVEKTR